MYVRALLGRTGESAATMSSYGMVGSFRPARASANGFCSNPIVGANPTNPTAKSSLTRAPALAMEVELPGCQGHSRDKSETRQVGKERMQIWMTHQQPPLHRHDRFHTSAHHVYQQSLAYTQQQPRASEGSGGMSIYSSYASVDSAISSASGQLACTGSMCVSLHAASHMRV